MKIKIGDEAKRHGFTDEEAGAIAEILDERLAKRFVVTEVSILVHELENKAEFQVTGATPKHGDQQFELNMDLKLFDDLDREAIINMIGHCAYECVGRDLEWMESGRSLGAPSTKQLEAAREFLFHHLANIEHEWLAAHPEYKSAATPEPLHIHLSNVMAALAPTRVDDAHRERAQDVLDVVLPGDDDHPIDTSPEDWIAAIAQAIADAEARGEQKATESR